MRSRFARTAASCAGVALVGTPFGYLGSADRADATSYLGSILFNTSAIAWLVVPVVSTLALRRPSGMLLPELVRFGSRADRGLRQLSRALRIGAVVMVTSTAVWSASAVLVTSGPVYPVLPFLSQALLLTATFALLFCTIRAVSDLHGRPWGTGAAVALWMWIVASEQGVISPMPPWSASALVDVRIGFASPAASVATVGLLLSTAGLLIGSALLHDRAERGSGVRQASRRLGPVTALLALIALATSLSDPSGRPLWQVLVAVVGNPTHDAIGAIIAVLLSLVLPWQTLLRSGDERRLLPDRLIRYGSVPRLFIFRVLRSIGPAATLLAGVVATVGAVFVAAGGRDLSSPPGGWVALTACYALVGLSGMVACIATLQLAVLGMPRRSSVLVAVTALGGTVAATSSFPPGPPRLAVDLTLSLDGTGWIPTAASSVGAALAVVLLGILVLRRHHQTLEF